MAPLRSDSVQSNPVRCRTQGDRRYSKVVKPTALLAKWATADLQRCRRVCTRDARCVFYSTGPNFAEGARLQVKLVPICIYISSASCPEEKTDRRKLLVVPHAARGRLETSFSFYRAVFCFEQSVFIM